MEFNENSSNHVELEVINKEFAPQQFTIQDMSKLADIVYFKEKLVKCFYYDMKYEFQIYTSDPQLNAVKRIQTKLSGEYKVESIKVLINDKKIYAIAQSKNGVIEFVDYESQLTIVRDFKDFSKSFKIYIDLDFLYLLDSVTLQVLRLSCNKINKILQEQEVKLRSYSFSDCFTSLQLIKILKKTTKEGETKVEFFGISNKDCLFKAQIVHQREQKKFYQYVNYAKSLLKTKLQGVVLLLQIINFKINIDDHIKQVYKEEGRNFQDFLIIPQSLTNNAVSYSQNLLISDKNSRVYLLDCNTFILLKVWKGQRDAQLALNNNNQVIVLLQKRNIIEIYDLDTNFIRKKFVALNKNYKFQLQNCNKFPILIGNNLECICINTNFKDQNGSNIEETLMNLIS